MATIVELYRNATKNPIKNELYGSDALRIESKGIINVPRTAALLASSPNTIADLIGSQVAGVLKGNANNPSDTIFRNKRIFSKPVTLSGGVSISQKKLKNTIEEGRPYFIKKSPAPQSILAKLKQGASSPLGLAGNAVASALRNPIGAAKSIKKFTNKLKNAKNDADMYGTIFMQDESGKTLKIDKKFSEWYPEYEKNGVSYERVGIEKRSGASNWDGINNNIINYNVIENDSKVKLYDLTKRDTNKTTYVKIKVYGKPESDSIILPGTISSLSEDFSPEWTNFRYVCSPFMNYRYTGVERSIKFNLKLYYVDETSKNSMIKSIENLKKLVFPDENVSVITYGENTNKRTQGIAFSPNLIFLTITGLYTNLFGYVEELGFNIDDTTSWATTNEDMIANTIDPYPTVIDVSFGMKVIRNTDGIKDNKIVYTFNEQKMDEAKKVEEKPNTTKN